LVGSVSREVQAGAIAGKTIPLAHKKGILIARNESTATAHGVCVRNGGERLCSTFVAINHQL
jgi:hypothetical protein